VQAVDEDLGHDFVLLVGVIRRRQPDLRRKIPSQYPGLYAITSTSPVVRLRFEIISVAHVRFGLRRADGLHQYEVLDSLGAPVAIDVQFRLVSTNFKHGPLALSPVGLVMLGVRAERA